MAKAPTLKVVPPAFRLQGSLPKIGIRPDDRRPAQGRPRDPRRPDHGHGQGRGRLHRRQPAPRQRPARSSASSPTPASAAWPRPPGRGEVRPRGRGVSLTVTPCWCYGSETMDMDPLMPKAVWGFNGTERPGAVYLAAVLAAHNQKGLPAFGIYGRDVQDCRRHRRSPPTCRRSSCASPAPAWPSPPCAASPTCRWAASRWASPARSSTRASSRATWACASRSVDMTEFVRRIDEKIYDPAEFKRALAWVKANCTEGKDYNPPRTSSARGRRRTSDWEIVVKMTMIAPRPDGRQPAPGRAGLRRGSARPQRHRRRLPGPAPVDRPLPQRRLHGERSSTRRSTGTASAQPFMFATENDSLNGVAMLFGHLLTNTAQVFADVRTYWSPAAVEARHRLRR